MRIVCLFLFIFCLFLLPAVAGENPNELLHFSSKQERVLVVKVNSSDSILLEDGRRMKLIGIESAGPIPYKPVERDKKGNIIEQPEEVAVSLEEQALTYAQDLMEGMKVK